MVDTAGSRKQVGKAIARGAVWTVSIHMAARFISVISTLILARLLTPSDFGLYALAMSVYAFIELIGAFGFGVALIQNQSATDEHYNTAWTLNFLFSLLCAFLLYVFAPLAAQLLQESRLEIVLKFTCLLFLVDAMKNIGTVNFAKHMTFDKEFRYRLSIKLSGFFVTVPLAFMLRSYWAMLWGLLVSSLVMVFLSYRMQPFRPRFGLLKWREMLGFSSWLQVNNLLNYFYRNIENFMVSRISGVAALGSLTMAKETGQLLYEVTGPINRAAFPGYARVNKDPARMQDVYCDVMGVLMIVGFPLALGVYSVAHLFVPIVLGYKWLHIIPLVKLLSLVTLLMVIMNSTNNVLIALAKVRWATGVIALRLLLLVSFLWYFLPVYGVIGVPYAILSTLTLVLGVSYFAMRKAIGLGLRRVAYLLYKPTISAVAMSLLLANWFPQYWAEASVPMQVAQLLAAVLVGAIFYTLVLLSMWGIESRPDGPELQFVRLIHERTGLLAFVLPKSEPDA